MLGSKDTKFLTRHGSDGSEYRIPVGIIQGHEPGEQITILAGQHGTEYDGIEAAHRVFCTLDPSEVRGRIVIGLVVNEGSFWDWVQFAPTPPEVQDMMKELAQGSNYLINCHGGEFSEGMSPYVICRLVGRDDLDAKAMEMAESFGVPYISVSKYRGEPPEDPSGVRPAWWLWPQKSLADELQIPAITPEIGQRGSRGDDDRMFGGIINVLKKLGFLEGKPTVPSTPPRTIGERFWLTAESDGLFFPGVDVGKSVAQGELLGVVRDYFGNLLQEVRAPSDAKVMNLNWGMPVKKGGFLLWLGVV